MTRSDSLNTICRSLVGRCSFRLRLICCGGYRR
nr:MAG TPA: hypothetical protein [Caudoviricetes sp.]